MCESQALQYQCSDDHQSAKGQIVENFDFGKLSNGVYWLNIIFNNNSFYFSSFDESWKVGSEGDVGAFWGLWDKDEKLKF